MCVLQGWVGYAMGQLLPTHASWTYGQQADRWRLCAALMKLLHAALNCPSTSGNDASLREVVAATLSQPGAASSCLGPALPPDAGPPLQWIQPC